MNVHGEPGITVPLENERTALLGENRAINSGDGFDFQQQFQSKAKGLAESAVRPVLKYAYSSVSNYLPDAASVERAETAQSRWFITRVLLELYLLGISVLPRTLAQLQEHSITLAPIVALGQLSTPALAASTLATAFANVTGYSIISGISKGLEAHLSPGSSRHHAQLWCLRALVITVIVFVPIFILWFNVEPLLIFAKQDRESAKLAGDFLRFSSLGIPAYSMSEIMKQYLASQRLESIQVRSVSLVAPITFALNYLLVHGPKSFQLGFVGAPLSTAISYNLTTILTLVGIAIHHFKTPHRPSDQVPSTSDNGQPQSEETFVQELKILGSSAVGSAARNAAATWSKDLGSFAVGMIGPTVVGSQAVILATVSTAYQLPTAVTAFSSARAKKLIDSKKLPASRASITSALVATLLLSGLTVGLLVLFAPLWIGIFTDDPKIQESVRDQMAVVAVYIVLHGYGAWLSGALQAMDRRNVFPALIASCDYFVGTPLGLLLMFGRHWGLKGLWAGLAVSHGCAVASATVVLILSHWEHHKRSIESTEETHCD